MNIQTLAKIPDQIGYLLLSDDGAIIASAGTLENSERTAEAIVNLLTITDKIEGVNGPGEGFHKLSVCFQEFFFVVTVSNKKIHVVQRKYTSTDNKPVTPASEPHVIDLQVSTNNSINA